MTNTDTMTLTTARKIADRVMYGNPTYNPVSPHKLLAAYNTIDAALSTPAAIKADYAYLAALRAAGRAIR